MRERSEQPVLGRRAALQWLLSGTALGLLAACAPTAPQAAAPTQAPAPKAAPTTSASAPTSVTSAAPTASGATGAVGPTSVSASTPAPTAAAQAQPKKGGTLHTGRAGDISLLEMHFISPFGANTFWLAGDRLLRYDDQRTPQPQLAESYELSTDNTQIKLNLRKGVQFHSGREFTSDDVKWNLLQVRDPKVGAAQLYAMSQWFTDIQTPDKYTVVLKTDTPQAGLFDMFEYLYISDRDVAEGPDAKTRVGGTGPFIWQDWQRAQSIQLVRNPNYWQSGKPYLDEILVTSTADAQAVVLQTEGNALELPESLPVRDALRLKDDPRFTYVPDTVGAGILVLFANTTVEPTNNKQFRQAISYALNRDRFVSTQLLGAADARDLPWPASSPANEPDKQKAQAFNLDKAKALVQASGVTPNFEFWYATSDPNSALLGQLLQADLGTIGVTMSLNGVESAQLLDVQTRVAYRGITSTAFSYTQLLPSTFFLLNRYINPYAPNQTGWKNDQFTQLVTQAAGEMDASKRKGLYSQINDLLLDESVMIPVCGNPSLTVSSKRVQDLSRNINSGFRLGDVWLA